MTWVACAQFSHSRQHFSHPLRLAFLFFTRRVHRKFKHSHVHMRFCVVLFDESDVWQWFIDSQPTHAKGKCVRVRQRMTYAHAYLAECWFACSGLSKYNVNDLLTRLICVPCSRSRFVFPFVLPSINSGTNFMQRRRLILLVVRVRGHYKSIFLFVSTRKTVRKRIRGKRIWKTWHLWIFADTFGHDYGKVTSCNPLLLFERAIYTSHIADANAHTLFC